MVGRHVPRRRFLRGVRPSTLRRTADVREGVCAEGAARKSRLPPPGSSRCGRRGRLQGPRHDHPRQCEVPYCGGSGRRCLGPHRDGAVHAVAAGTQFEVSNVQSSLQSSLPPAVKPSDAHLAPPRSHRSSPPATPLLQTKLTVTLTSTASPAESSTVNPRVPATSALPVIDVRVRQLWLVSLCGLGVRLESARALLPA